MTGLETSDLRLGFIPLNDCAPLAVAAEMGFFEREGLHVQLSREASWANIRDKVAVGVLDGGHMLAPMTLASTMGVGAERTPMIVPLSMNLNGSAVTVSTTLAEQLREVDPEGMAEHPRSARPVARLIEKRREAGLEPLVFAVVFAYSMHAYQLRYWLASAGVDPDKDLRLIVAPPPRMAERLAASEIDGFCVGAPWNAYAVREGLGEILIYASEFWRVGPDKAFGVTQAWADEHPAALRAVVRALISAAQWADASENRKQLAAMLAADTYVGAPQQDIERSLTGAPPYAPGVKGKKSYDYIIFSRYAASFPWRSHALWFLTQMLRWGQIGPEVDLKAVARSVYRPEIYRQAAADLGVAAPLIDDKPEGNHHAPWTLEAATAPLEMSPDQFFDGALFDPRRFDTYVASFPISRLRR
jgi:ABC-type nitrate/sulfonate/bicarbonate transport system substrate-binding protein